MPRRIIPHPVTITPPTSTHNRPFADGMPAGGNNISAGTAIRLPVRRADAVMETGDTFGIIWNRMPPIAIKTADITQTICGSHKGISVSRRSCGAAIVSAVPRAPASASRISPAEATANPAHLRLDTGVPRKIRDSTRTSTGMTA